MAQRIVDITSDEGQPIAEGQAPASELEQESHQLPEKFKGKTVDDIIQSYESLEKELGRKGNELGELRRVADQLIARDLQTSNQTATAQEEDVITDEAFLENPVEAVTKIVERAVKPVTETVEVSRKEASLQTLKAKHPDANEIVQDPKFQDWVMEKASRQVLWTQASEGNVLIADEMFNDWKELNSKPDTTTNNNEQQLRDEQMGSELADAAAISRGSASDSNVEGGNKPTYKRADLIRLQIEDPLRYKQMQPEIMEAYAAGRVK